MHKCETRPTGPVAALARGLVSLTTGTLILLAAGALPGCREAPPAKGGGGSGDAARSLHLHGDTLFNNAVGQLNQLEEFPDSRETLHGIVSRLDQWIQGQKPLAAWEADPSIESTRQAALETGGRVDALCETVRSIQTAVEPRELLDETATLVVQLRETAAAFQRLHDDTQSAVFINLGAEFEALAKMLEEQLDAAAPSAAEATASAIQSQLSGFNLDGLTPVAAAIRDLAARLDLAKLDFEPTDAAALEQAVWLRDISRWAPGDAVGDLDRVCATFDWTVRNIELVPELVQGPEGVMQYPTQAPWQTLLTGRGTAIDRAWVFVLLLRQMGIDAALLSVHDGNADSGQELMIGVGVLLEDDVYLFEPRLGMPFPAPGGIELDEQGTLKITPVTLAEAATDDRVFRQLDSLMPGDEFPMRSERLAHVTARVVASPAELSQRMAKVESQLSGENRIVLSTSAVKQAERLKRSPGIESAELFPRPVGALVRDVLVDHKLYDPRLTPQADPEFLVYKIAWRLGLSEWEDRYVEAEDDGRNFGNIDQIEENKKSEQQDVNLVERTPDTLALVSPLWKGKACYFAGSFSGEESAASYLQKARFSERELLAMDDQTHEQFSRVKLTASYSLGVITAEQGFSAPVRDEIEAARRDTYLSTAADYLKKWTLDQDRTGAHVAGALYHLGRIAEAQADYEQAIRWYRSDPGTAQRLGNRLRAAMLEQLTVGPAEDETSADSGPPMQDAGEDDVAENTNTPAAQPDASQQEETE